MPTTYPTKLKSVDMRKESLSEAFFATFKREEVYRRKYPSEKHFCQSVEEYIRFYNEVCPHQTLNYKAPQAFEASRKTRFTEKQRSDEDTV